ncbi:MAG: (deoxy)nucleoside triphosphate pyrophosphohydrolase [Paludibacteraceae bacterium]|jgi:8-oxo-dGTP diphosphatase|nr:(deoxy)nucleoside triphosphate pyrophosphohydrolase [Paludibacteraceae bacterium]MBR6105818.1 (deoxy)nucleoside triphosphate pyrophosphohydrolase [Paludibacteraceae bacterium]
MKRIEVVAAVILQDGKVFATQRGYGDYKDGWEFPGGKIESGESRELAVVREIREELATTVSVDKFLTTVEHDYPTFHLTMHCFLCSVVSGNLQLLEHEDCRWLDATTLLSVDWLPADIAVLPIVENLLRK